jgi:hypothetical protein
MLEVVGRLVEQSAHVAVVMTTADVLALAGAADQSEVTRLPELV